MAEPKSKPQRREAGKSKFRLPERPPRVVEVNPLRDILREAKAQEEALTAPPPPQPEITPAKQIAEASGETAAPPLTAPDAASFDEFSERWSSILRSGRMRVCRALFEMTYAVGLAECFISIPKLAAAAGIKERQCYNVVAQLELLGFVVRPEVFNTSTKKGTVFRLNLAPQPTANEAQRLYHIGGEVD